MMDVGPHDGLKADLEYWYSLNEESFQNYIDHENNVLQTEGSTDRFSFDYFREELNETKRTLRVFVDEFDNIIASLRNIDDFKKEVFGSTVEFKIYLGIGRQIFPRSLKNIISAFTNVLKGPITKVTAIAGIS